MRLQEFLHVKPGKGAAFVRTKIKNLVNGSVLDRTFRAGESIILADVTKTEMQYTYTNGGLLYFMNMETFEEQSVDAKKVSNVDMLIEGIYTVLSYTFISQYIEENHYTFYSTGLSCSVCQWDDRVIDVQLPQQVVYTVVETDPTLKSKEQGTLKAAKLDSGATINVPMFIDNGEQILVSTEDRKYVNRANGKSFS